MDTSNKLLASSVMEGPDLVEEMHVCTSELNLQNVSGNAKKAPGKYRRKVAKRLLFALPKAVTEQQLRQTVELYQQAGTEAREEETYPEALKKLERGQNMLRKWGVESAELNPQLSAVSDYFGRYYEACELLRQGLLLSPSVEMSLRLNNELIEVYSQVGKREM